MATPTIGEFVYARGRSWLVEAETGIDDQVKALSLSCVADDAQGDALDIVWDLALLFHLIDAGNGPIDVTSMRRALDWATYLEPHAMRVFATPTLAHNGGARLILRRIQRGELPAEFTAREVQRRGWSGLTDKEAVAAALDLLVDCNVVREKFVQTGGRPSTVFRVNPKALKR